MAVEKSRNLGFKGANEPSARLNPDLRERHIVVGKLQEANDRKFPFDQCFGCRFAQQKFTFFRIEKVFYDIKQLAKTLQKVRQNFAALGSRI